MKGLLAAAALGMTGCLSDGGKPAPEMYTRSVEGLAEARPQEIIDVKDGDTVTLTAAPVKKVLRGREARMLAYNGSIPGPLIRAPQGAAITVVVKNRLGFPTTLHSHGVRLNYRDDGSTTAQSPIPDGGSFAYAVSFPDAGMFWYHGHLREDYTQQMGLYGGYLVVPRDSSYWKPADREVSLMIQDVLVDDGGVAATPVDHADHAMMGRFGNVYLVNGDTAWTLSVKRKEVVRFYATNACNARVLNLGLYKHEMKVVGSDNGAYAQPQWPGYELAAPGERLIFEGYFPDTGTVYVTHAIMPPGQPTTFVTLGAVHVEADSVASGYGDAFAVTAPSAEAQASIDSLKPWFDKEPDKLLVMTSRMGGMDGHMSMGTAMKTAAMKTAAESHVPGGMGIEWDDPGGMDMNSDEMTWILRDSATGLENHQINWHFQRGDKVMIRVYNDSLGMHPMPHPLHFHGQRFLVVRENGKPNPYLAWKDTYLVGRGFTIDLLLDASNPGEWMAHCHIAEHLESSMMLHFSVD